MTLQELRQLCQQLEVPMSDSCGKDCSEFSTICDLSYMESDQTGICATAARKLQVHICICNTWHLRRLPFEPHRVALRAAPRGT